ncbi:membrane protein, putative [hydrothermal vent metagenome]|uniref:Membrane protein, putative n=1 Tax=hydrothermal vent metagenome TaxID=652676 RepID=A0A1W1CIP7_9ZZZZ
MKKLFIFLLLALFSFFTVADELKLSYLEITENSPKSYSLLLKIPLKDKKKIDISVQMPKGCKSTLAKRTQSMENTSLETWQIACDDGLSNQNISIHGLGDLELLLRLDLLSQSHSILLNTSKASYSIPKTQESFEIVQTYTWLGITHILIGLDHLLFVFALLLIVKNMHRLLWTITAFTLAHSLTMIVATLGIINLPQAPVEAIIALSILFLAMEILHEKEGKIGLTSRYPWLIAFIFGLLHGFGFAGALADIGLPQQAITLALLFFNIGVELGQLIFIASVVFTVILLRRLNIPTVLENLQTIIVYMMGGISAFWLIERTLSF